MKTQFCMNRFIAKGLLLFLSFLLVRASPLGAQNRPLFEDVTICRIQIRVTTANKENAGTDVPLYVRLNSADNRFYLDHGKNDFERNSSRSYDLLSKNIDKIGDIQFFELGIKSKKDGWIGKKVELLVNGYVIFEKIYPKGITLKGDSKYPLSKVVFEGSELRRNGYWRYNNSNGNMWKAPRLLPRDMIEAVIEAGIGHTMQIRGNLYWDNKMHGRAHVETKFSSSNTLHLDLDLKQRLSNRFDCGVDVDFDLIFSCLDGKIALQVDHLVINTSTLCKLQAEVWKKIQEDVKKAIAALIQKKYPEAGPIAQGLLDQYINFDFGQEIKFEPDLNTPGIHSCKTIEVTTNGDILITPDQG